MTIAVIFASLILKEKLTIDEVPEKIRSQVQDIIDA